MIESKDIAALYVLANGPYSEVAGVDLWDIARDARRYAGPCRVVAHPPCVGRGAEVVVSDARATARSSAACSGSAQGLRLGYAEPRSGGRTVWL